MREYTILYVSRDGFFCIDWFYGKDGDDAVKKFLGKHPDCRNITSVELGFARKDKNAH